MGQSLPYHWTKSWQRQQHAEACKLLIEEGYDAMPLPIVLRSARACLKFLSHATVVMRILKLDEEIVQAAPLS
jgi:hypothetical protein